MLDLHLNKVLLHWRLIMFSILYHRQPFFKNYDFSLIPCIKFSHLANNFMHAHPHHIFHRFFYMGSS
jgi:hypothetical protein